MTCTCKTSQDDSRPLMTTQDYFSIPNKTYQDKVKPFNTFPNLARPSEAYSVLPRPIQTNQEKKITINTFKGHCGPLDFKKTDKTAQNAS